MTKSRHFLDDIHPLDPEYWSSALDGELSPQEMERLLKYPPQDLRQVRDAWQQHQRIGHYLRHGSCHSASLTERVMGQICPQEAREVANTPVARSVQSLRWRWPLHGFRLVTAGLAVAAITTWVSSTFFLSKPPEGSIGTVASATSGAPKAEPVTQIAAPVTQVTAPVTQVTAPMTQATATVRPTPMGPAMTVNATGAAPVAKSALPQDPVLFASQDGSHYKMLDESKSVADSSLDEFRMLHWSQTASRPQAQLIAEMHGGQ